MAAAACDRDRVTLRRSRHCAGRTVSPPRGRRAPDVTATDAKIREFGAATNTIVLTRRHVPSVGDGIAADGTVVEAVDHTRGRDQHPQIGSRIGPHQGQGPHPSRSQTR